MKMKPFRYSTQIALRETINGLLWCIAAILWVFDNPACKGICVVLLAIAVSSQAFSIFGKFEKSDEMATANLREAKAVSLDISRIILLAVSVVLLLDLKILKQVQGFMVLIRIKWLKILIKL